MSDINGFLSQGRHLEAELRQLLLQVRGYLDRNEETDLYEAESDLYDSIESLQDFIAACETSASA